MPAPAAQINALVERFVAGQPVEEFQRDFMAFYESFDRSVLSDAQRDAYWAVFDLVRMSQPGPGMGGLGTVGYLDEDALRERLRHFHLREPAASKPDSRGDERSPSPSGP